MTRLEVPGGIDRSPTRVHPHPIRVGALLAVSFLVIPWLATAALATDITINTDPPGRRFYIDGASYTSPQTVSRPPTSQLQISVDELQVAGDTRYKFESWSDGSTDAWHQVIVPPVATTYTATFTTQYHLDPEAVPSVGGTITASPPSSDGFYDSGQSVTLTAVGASNYAFHDWGGDVAAGSPNPVSLSMIAPRTATATFYPNTVITTDPVGLKVMVTVTANGTTTTTTASSPYVVSEAPETSVGVTALTPQFVGQAKYEFLSWSDGKPASHNVTTSQTPSTITARFQTKYKLTTGVTPPSAGSISRDPASSDCQNGGCYYLAGTTVALTATPAADYQFDNWAGDLSGTSNPNAVTISSGIQVMARFSRIKYVVTTNPPSREIRVDGKVYQAPHTFFWTPGSEHTLEVDSPQASNGTRYEFMAWSDGEDRSHTVIAPSISTTYTATFQTRYLLTTSVDPTGTGTVAANPPSADGFYDAGEAVALTATPAYGFEFTRWSGDVAGSTNPEQVVLSSPKAVSATFSPVSFVVATEPPGLEILVDDVSYTAPQTFLWTPDTSHRIAVTSPQSGTGTQYIFTGWSDGNDQSHDLIAPAVSTSYLATFRQRFALTISVDPPGSGTVDVAPASQDGFYDQGSVVELTPAAGYGYEFAGWSGDVEGASGHAQVTMGGQRSVVARFEPVKVVVTTIPAGLGIRVDGASYVAPQTFTWTPDTPHSIAVDSPQGDANTQYVFTGWSDGGDPTHDTMAPGVATTYTATFRSRYRATVAVNPAGSGSVNTTPPSPDGFYDAGTTVHIAAVAGPGYEFASWSGGLGGSVNPQTLVLSAPVLATANFSRPFTIASVPSGRFVTVDGATIPAPAQVNWIPGSTHLIGAPSPQPFAFGSRYSFANWSDGRSAFHTVVAPPTPTIYTATFQVQYQLLASVTPDGAGTITFSPPSPDGYFDSGTNVSLSAVAGSGNEFSGWGGDLTGTVNPTSLLMFGPHSVSATFSTVTVVVTTDPAGQGIVVDGQSFTAPRSFTWEPGSEHMVSVDSPIGGGPSRLVFSNWSDHGAQAHQVTAPEVSTTLTAKYRQQYLLTTFTNTPGQGTIDLSPPSQDGYYDAGETVTLTASPGPGNPFVAWSGDLTGSDNPGYVTMDGPKTVTAIFTQEQVVTTDPVGMEIVVDGGAPVPSPHTYSWAPGTQHTLDVLSPHSDAPGSRYLFASWSDQGTQAHGVTAPAVSTTYTATFKHQYELTITVDPASKGFAVPTSGTFFDEDVLILLNATGAGGYVFFSWEGNVPTTYTNPANILMNGPQSVIVHFRPGYVVGTSPVGLTFDAAGDTYSTTKTFLWSQGWQALLNVDSPQFGAPGTQYVFQSWSDGGGQSHWITIPPDPATYIASFSTLYALTTSVNPPGTGEVVPQTGSFYSAGSVASLAAEPYPGYQFVNWSGDVTGTSTLTTVTMDAPRAAVANFARTGTTGAGESDGPVQFSIGSALPNPGSGVRDLTYSMPTAGRVTLRVFDVAGRELATLVDGELPSGWHHTRFSTEGWSSGIYYIRLEMAGRRRTGRMVVMK